MGTAEAGTRFTRKNGDVNVEIDGGSKEGRKRNRVEHIRARQVWKT